MRSRNKRLNKKNLPKNLLSKRIQPINHSKSHLLQYKHSKNLKFNRLKNINNFSKNNKTFSLGKVKLLMKTKIKIKMNNLTLRAKMMVLIHFKVRIIRIKNNSVHSILILVDLIIRNREAIKENNLL